MKIGLYIAATAIMLSSAIGAQAVSTPKKVKGKKATADSIAKPSPGKGSIEATLKADTKRNNGLLTVAVQDGKYYLLLPTSQIGRDFLIVNRITQAPAELRSGFVGYAGDQIAEAMVRFAMSPDKKTVFLQNILTREMPRDTVGEMYENVIRSNFQPIVQSFEIKGQNKSKDTVLIDITDFLLGDNELTAFDPWIKSMVSIGGLQKDKSYIDTVKTFPINTEFRTVKSYTHTPSGAFMGKPIPSKIVTFGLNTSFIALPEIPMQPRYADNRVGYFSERYVDFDKNPQGVENLSLITRWRLEPKPEDVEKYKAGELVEPAEPIIYYIDPTTPEKWVPYLMQGVNDWEPVFRKAGFKNAIMALRAPIGDSTWSLEDARHSAIVYKPSTIPNASGPHVHDPRTGQILESHINWYHNVMSLLHDWYMLQVGPNDPRARQMVFPDSLMGELVRFVSSHEVGHTLGLRHNFGATAMVPVDSLRSATYLEKYGHTPSIMDYSRFNYAVQPEDGIAPELQYPRIKEYDEWAIEWGYRRFPDLTTPEAEKTKLNEWIIEAQKNPRLWFGHEMNSDDPRSQAEDLGDDQMKANDLGIKNLQRVTKGLPTWTATKNEGYDNLEKMYNEVKSQYIRYIGHVAKWLGGIYENPRTIEQGSDVYAYAPADKQRQAMVWLDKQLFTTPTWLFDTEIFRRTGTNTTDEAAMIYSNAMRRIVSARVIKNLVNAEAELGAKAYTASQYFVDLYKGIFGKTSSVAVRQMQKSYVETLLSLIPSAQGIGVAPTSEVASLVEAELRKIQSRLLSMEAKDSAVAAHNKYLAARIKEKLDNKK